MAVFRHAFQLPPALRPRHGPVRNSPLTLGLVICFDNTDTDIEVFDSCVCVFLLSRVELLSALVYSFLMPNFVLPLYKKNWLDFRLPLNKIYSHFLVAEAGSFPTLLCSMKIHIKFQLQIFVIVADERQWPIQASSKPVWQTLVKPALNNSLMTFTSLFQFIVYQQASHAHRFVCCVYMSGTRRRKKKN